MQNYGGYNNYRKPQTQNNYYNNYNNRQNNENDVDEEQPPQYNQYNRQNQNYNKNKYQQKSNNTSNSNKLYFKVPFVRPLLKINFVNDGYFYRMEGFKTQTPYKFDENPQFISQMYKQDFQIFLFQLRDVQFELKERYSFQYVNISSQDQNTNTYITDIMLNNGGDNKEQQIKIVFRQQSNKENMFEFDLTLPEQKQMLYFMTIILRKTDGNIQITL